MLEDDYRQELTARLAVTECRIQVPRSLRHVFERSRASESKADERRRFVRFSSPVKMLLELGKRIRGIDRKQEFFSILTTDISRDGVAFLHAHQLFPGEVPVLWFCAGKLPCRVARCLRHNAHCFEIGAVFESGAQSAAWLRHVTGKRSGQSGRIG